MADELVPAVPPPPNRFGGALRRWLDTFQQRRQSSISNQVMVLHLLWTFLVGGVAVTALWWTASRLIEHTLEKQSEQWITELDVLGAPLYTSSKKQVLGEIRQRLANFHEVAYARYYDATGTRLLGSYAADPARPIPEFTPALLAKVTAREPAQGAPYFERYGGAMSYVRAIAPVRIHSMSSAALFNYKVENGPDEQVTVIGYIDIGMDIGHLHDQFRRNLIFGALVILALVGASIVVGRYYLRRALLPLTSLQRPLAQLANGDIDVIVEATGPAEVAAISRALTSTIGALKERDQRLRRLAEYDALTGLFNRSIFNGLLANEMVNIEVGGDASAVLFIDLDQFKYVNDTLGHAAGDRLLIQFAEQLRARVRADDIVARFGGDEFVVLARHVNKARAIEIGCSLLDLMQGFSFLEDGRRFNVYCSIGIAMIEPGMTAIEEIVSHADMACHEAKASGRNRLHMHESHSGDRKRMAAEVSWTQLIRQALDDDRLVMHYQPIVRLQGECATEFYEVLVRLPGATEGEVIPPDVFLPAAERFGLISEIDRWVVTHSLRALAEYREHGVSARLAINLSAQSLSNLELLPIVERELKHLGLPPSVVVFEVTEQAAVSNFDKTRVLIQRLQGLGCSFALDDFGSGFSSFGYLKRLPLDYIKIGNPFVNDIADDPVNQAIVRSIVQLARALGKEIVAEAVEDARTLALLREYGVDYVQGRITGMPVPGLGNSPMNVFALGKNPDRRGTGKG